MRLLNTSSYELEDFFGKKAPPYAILSHRWCENEVSFKEYRKNRTKGGPRFRKIITGCDFARSQGQQHLWVDTCCIDMRSSAEVNEVINSMFDWCLNSTVCYVYLSDVRSPASHNSEDFMNDFRASEWFTRGWTLLELIVPGNVMFCSSTWDVIGVKKRTNVSDPYDELFPTIEQITGIPSLMLVHDGNYTHSGRFSAAQKMSWAAKRKTTRIEDTAYCLIGLLGVNLAIIYGERQNAFKRLIAKILETSNDESVFAWSGASRSLQPYQDESLGPTGPSNYLEMGNILPYRGCSNPRFKLENGGFVSFRPSAHQSSVFVRVPEGRSILVAIPLLCYGCTCEHSSPACPNGLDAELTVETRLVFKQLSCGHWSRLHWHSFHDDMCGGPGANWERSRDRDFTMFFHYNVNARCSLSPADSVDDFC